MESLSQKFNEDLVIVGFPCNQFGLQEPGGNGEEIYNGIKNVRPGGGFEPTFYLTHKIEVNGENAEPLYKFLRATCPCPIDFFDEPSTRLYYEFKSNADIRWNWAKVLIGRDGKPVKRYLPGVVPDDIAPDIEELINQ